MSEPIFRTFLRAFLGNFFSLDPRLSSEVNIRDKKAYVNIFLDRLTS